MLRLTPRRSRRLPYGLTILGAFLLAAVVLAGAGRSMPTDQRQAGMQQTAGASAREAATEVHLEDGTPLREAAVTKTRKFRVNLFLFRH